MIRTTVWVVLLGVLVMPPLATGQEDQEPAASQEDEQERRVRRLRDSLAVDAEAEWVPNLQGSDRDAEIDRKLTVAQKALENGDLISPPSANALFFYLQVLDLEPGHPDAEAGVDRVADQLVAQARAAYDAGDRQTALNLISAVQGIRPSYPGLATLEAEVTRRGEIAALLRQAQEHVTANRLTQPEGENALATYRAVLEIEPDNADALRGIEAIGEALVSQATAARQAGDLETAEELLDRAQTVGGASTAITAEREIIADTRRQQEWADALAGVRAEVEAGNLDAAESGLEALLASGYEADSEVQALRDEIAHIRRLRAYPAGSTFADTLAAGGEGPTMVVIPDGSFSMGSPSRDRDRSESEGPQQEIVFTVPFAISQTELTVGQFRRFVEATGYVTDAEKNGRSTIYNVLAGSLKDDAPATWRNDFQGQDADDDLPVVHVSWNDATAYATWLAEQTGQPYRLPTEAEFEYALKAGTTTPYWWGTGAPRDEVENLTGERDRMAGRWEWPNPFERYGDDHWGPAPVASFETNAFGLFDMGGNVMEWTLDCYAGSLAGVPTDGSARTDGNCGVRVLKGGSWATPPAMSRSANRSSLQPNRTTALVGFRVARDL